MACLWRYACEPCFCVCEFNLSDDPMLMFTSAFSRVSLVLGAHSCRDYCKDDPLGRNACVSRMPYSLGNTRVGPHYETPRVRCCGKFCRPMQSWSPDPLAIEMHLNSMLTTLYVSVLPAGGR